MNDEASLAWNHTVSIQESFLPPARFHPAQRYCWDRKLPDPPVPYLSLVAPVLAFQTDKELRNWVQEMATLPERYTLWLAINNLGCHFFVLEDGEEPDERIVEAIRSHPDARSVFALALRTAHKDQLMLSSESTFDL